MRTPQELTEEVDKVAKDMCVEMGLDPLSMVQCDVNDTYAPHENAFLYRNAQTLPLVGSNGQPITIETVMTTPTFRWRSLRRAAAEALIGWRAVHRYTMTEAGVTNG